MRAVEDDGDSERLGEGCAEEERGEHVPEEVELIAKLAVAEDGKPRSECVTTIALATQRAADMSWLSM